MKNQHPLPFIQADKYWSVQPTGDYALDCKIGQQYARQFIHYMQKEHFPPLLTWVTQDMPKSFSGIEVTFLETVATYAIGDKELAA